MFAELIVAVVGCLVGAGLITTLTKSLEQMPADTTRERLTYYIAAGWLVLLAVFFLTVLASALERVSGG
jgi:hypothetical protein